MIAFNTLMQEEVSSEDLDKADNLFRLFLKDVSTLYSEIELTYNVHQLQHVCLNVRRWGPIFMTSAFCFENFIGLLGKSVHGNIYIGQEISGKINLAQGLQVLRSSVEIRRGIRSADQNENKLCRGKAVKTNLTADEAALFHDLPVRTLKIFYRARIHRRVSTSLIYRTIKKPSIIVSASDTMKTRLLWETSSFSVHLKMTFTLLFIRFL